MDMDHPDRLCAALLQALRQEPGPQWPDFKASYKSPTAGQTAGQAAGGLGGSSEEVLVDPGSALVLGLTDHPLDGAIKRLGCRPSPSEGLVQDEASDCAVTVEALRQLLAVIGCRSASRLPPLSVSY